MAVQTTFETSQGVAFAGQRADPGISYTRTAFNEEAVAIPFGVMAVQGTLDQQALLYGAPGLDPLGVVTHTHAFSNQDLSNDDGVAVGAVFSVLRLGRVFVLVETGDTGVVAGGAVYCRHTAGVGEQEGSFRSDSDGGDATLIPGLQFLTTAAAGEHAVLDVNLPNIVATDSPSVLLRDHIQVTADALTNFVYQVPAGRTFILDTAKYYNLTGLVADAANYFVIAVVNATGTVVAADWSTETGQEGSATADTPLDMTLAALADRTFVGGDRINLSLDETGTATLPAGTVQITGRLI